MSLFKNIPQPKSRQQGVKTDNSHLLQDLPAHRPLPSMPTDNMFVMPCYINIKYILYDTLQPDGPVLTVSPLMPAAPLSPLVP